MTPIIFAEQVGIFLITLGTVAIAIPVSSHVWSNPPPWLNALAPTSGIALIILAIIWLVAISTNMLAQVNGLAIVSLIISLVFFIGMARVIAPITYDVRPLAQELQQIEAHGFPIAIAGKYYGQYQFYGRLHTVPTR